MKTYRDAVSTAPGVHDWILTRRTVTEAQRYLIFDRPESARTVERTSTSVVAFHDHEGGRGRAEVTLDGRDALLEPRALEEAVFAASLQSNPPYELPAPAPLAAVELADPELAGAPGPALAALQDRLFAAVAAEADLRLSSAELFVERTVTELATSTGVDAGKTETELFLDLVVLAGRGEGEAESHGAYRVRRVADLDVEAIVARHGRFARDATRATPTPDHAGPLVLTEGCFVPLFRPFGFLTSAEAVYRKMSAATVGAPLLGDREVRGDRLTVVNDPTLPYATSSTPFDAEGLALGPVTIIDAGAIRQLAASKRYADYLGVPATGEWSNASIPAGGTSLSGLLDPTGGPVLELVEFSWLNPDAVRGRFSTEVRLGYLHDAAGSRPVKGGAFAGSCYDLFADVRFSRETSLLERYQGPLGLRFEAGRILGA